MYIHMNDAFWAILGEFWDFSAELSRLFRILKNVKMRYKKRHHKNTVKS